MKLICWECDQRFVPSATVEYLLMMGLLPDKGILCPICKAKSQQQ